MDWVSEYYKVLVAKFMDLYENKIPKFGEPVDRVGGVRGWDWKLGASE